MTLRSSATTSRTKLTRRPMIPGRSASLTLTPFCTGGPAFLPAPAVFGFVTVPGPLLRAVLLVFDEVLVDLVVEQLLVFGEGVLVDHVVEAFVHGVFAAPLSIGHFPPSSVEPEDRQPRIQCLAASPASPASASPGLGVAGPVWPARAGAVRAGGAGATGLEPATCGFGDRCATNCATPLCEATLPATGAPRQGPITPRATSVRVTSRLSQPGRRS